MSCLQQKYNKLRTMPSQEQRNVRNVNVQVTERSQSFKYEHEDIKHSWRLRNKNNNFYFNVTQWLARPGGTKLSKLIEKVSKKELNGFPKRFFTSAKKKAGKLSIQLNPSKSRHWSFPFLSLIPFLWSHNYRGRPSFSSFSFSADQDEGINAS